MINIVELFENKLVNEELAQSRLHGIKIVIPVRSILPNESHIIHNITAPKFLESLYSAHRSLEILWNISNNNQPTIDIFKKDSWIKENYLDEGYEWSFVHEMLSGYINIQKLEDILKPEFCKEQGYYYKLKWKDGINADDYLPFDICSGMTACLKVENGKILDNIWLVITEDVDDCLHDMKVTIEEYLNLAYQAKLFRHWQAIFLWKNEYDRFELMKRFLPKIVPHVQLDLSSFGIE
jgi:hypothetical protein